MRKRFVTAIVAMLSCIALAVCFTACGNNENDNNKENDNDYGNSEIVTEEQWNDAFNATLSSAYDNVTASVEYKSLRTSSRNKDVYSGTRLDITWKSGDYKSQLKLENVKLNSPEEEYTSSINESYGFVDGSIIYSVSSFSSLANSWNTQIIVESGEFEGAEQAKTFYSAQSLSSALNYSNYNVVYKEGEEGTPVSELYSSFKYEKGRYVATFKDVVFESYKSDLTTKVEIIGGHVTEYSEHFAYEDSDGYVITYTIKCTFSDYGDTAVTIPEEVYQAIEDIKEDN